MFNIYEQPWGLLAAAFIALVAVWIVRAVIPRKRHWWQWLIPLMIAAAAVPVDIAVETDTEKIKAVIYAASKAVEQENLDDFEKIISENYSDSLHQTREQLIRHCRVRLSRPLVRKNITRFISINTSGTNATVVLTIRMLFDPQSYVYQSYKGQIMLKVQVDLQKQGQRWLISRAELLSLDYQPTSWKGIQQIGH